MTLNDEKMTNICLQLQKYLNSTELETRLDIFEQDLFVKLRSILDRLENKLSLNIEQKANKQEIKDDIICKANFTDLQHAKE